MTEAFEQKTERNKRVQARYDELSAAGKHGHYETMLRVVMEEVASARAAALEEAARVADQYAEVNLEAAHDTVLARYQTAEDIATAIRALGEERAAERETATS